MSIFKKIFIVSTALLGVTVFLWGIYNFSFKKEVAEKKIKETDDSLFDFIPEQKKEVKKIEAVTEESVLSPGLEKETGRLFYYNKENGNVLRLDTESGERKIISSDNLFGLKNVSWSPKFNKVISHFQKNEQDEFYFYNYDERNGTKLKIGLDNAVWTNLGDKIVYKYFDVKTKTRTLNIADPDGSNWKELAKLEFKNMNIAQVPQSSIVAFWNFPNSFEETKMSTVGMMGGEINNVFGGKFGGDYLWSPNGEKVMLSAVENKGGSRLLSGVINKNGGEYLNLVFPTMASKCVWGIDSKTLYCALPGSIPETAVMPNDYFEKKVMTKDTFWKINFEDGVKKERIVEIEDLKNVNKDFDASNLMLSKDESAIFFVNRYDDKVYRINLDN